MKIIREKEIFQVNAQEIWDIISDPTDSSWVPTVEEISLEGDVRSFSMEGMGELKEKILKIDQDNKIFQYSAIQTPAPIEHHLATIQIFPLENDNCEFSWTTEIEPEIFAEGIHQGMLISLKELKKLFS
tara:strand:- start:92 stop:478 length:387 start_codon:yes stop_codon:yes gene_type:complete